MDAGCEICGTTQRVDHHHVRHRRMGGSSDPAVHDHTNLMTVCRRCHRQLHEGGWRLERLPEGIRVLDQRTGKQVMRRLRSADVDAATLFHGLTLVEASFAGLVDLVPYLTDDQLVEAFASTLGLGKRAWLVQAAILYEAQQRSIYGDQTLEAIARRFEISLRQAQKYALVWTTFFARATGESEPDDALKNVNVDEIVLDEPSWYVVAASESPNPDRWLAYAQDRKLEDPRYSIAAFRRDLRLARRATGATGPPIAGLGADENGADRLGCPWVRPYCIRSGVPLAVDRCAACDPSAHDTCKTTPVEA